MSERRTRDELERALRGFLPRTPDMPESLRSADAQRFGTGVGGLFIGYALGFIRGRRRRGRS
jgi:hypothetical protein